MQLMIAQHLLWWNITLYGSVLTLEVKQNFPTDLLACWRLFYDLFIYTSFIFILTGGWPLLFSSSLSKIISLSESVVGLFKKRERKNPKVLGTKKHFLRNLETICRKKENLSFHLRPSMCLKQKSKTTPKTVSCLQSNTASDSPVS